MSIFKESFRGFVRKQLEIRQAIVASGNDKVGRERAQTIKFSKGAGGEEITIDSHAFFTNTVNRACVIRMCSGVDLNPDSKNLLEGGRYENPDDLVYNGLAKRYILEGGTMINLDKDPNDPSKGGIKSLRRGFPGVSSRGWGFGYGDPVIRGDASTGTDNYGIVPMPGIIDLNVRTKTAYGSLREAKVKFVCHNQRQLEILELLYMRPGYPVMVEWGWVTYIGNDGKRTSEFPHISEFFSPHVTQEFIYRQIIKNKIKTGGNYDGLLGICKNFSYKARADGGYDCQTELVATGEIIEQLGVKKTAIKDENDEWVLKDEVKNMLSKMAGLNNISTNYTHASDIAASGPRDITFVTKTNEQTGEEETEVLCGPATCCFVAGTKVTMNDNSKKNIEEVEIGDIVKSWNENTGEINNNKVTLLKRPKMRDIVALDFEDIQIKNTFNHPYYVENKGWSSYKPELTMEAYSDIYGTVNQLEVGDICYKHNNGKLEKIPLTSIKEEVRDTDIQTYLITVENDNTFFANNVLTHNKR
jgi:hypothetical protein